MRFLFHLLLLTTLSALAGAAWVAHRPSLPAQDEAARAALPPRVRDRDLVDHLKQTAIKATPVEVSEAELNHHLERVLKGAVQPSMGVMFERLHVDLEADVARLHLVWRLYGRASTARVDLKVTRLPKTFQVEVVGGAYGHLEVPRGLLRPLTPALAGLAAALKDEVNALFQMNQVRLGRDKLLLDPRFP